VRRPLLRAAFLARGNFGYCPDVSRILTWRIDLNETSSLKDRFLSSMTLDGDHAVGARIHSPAGFGVPPLAWTGGRKEPTRMPELPHRSVTEPPS